MGQFSNSLPKHFSYLCEYAFRFDLSCSFCEYPIIFHCLHCSPSCFDPDSLLLAHLWLGLSWIDSISAKKRFSSPKTSSRKPYTSNKQQERQKYSGETTINFSFVVFRSTHLRQLFSCSRSYRGTWAHTAVASHPLRAADRRRLLRPMECQTSLGCSRQRCRFRATNFLGSSLARWTPVDRS